MLGSRIILSLMALSLTAACSIPHPYSIKATPLDSQKTVLPKGVQTELKHKVLVQVADAEPGHYTVFLKSPGKPMAKMGDIILARQEKAPFCRLVSFDYSLKGPMELVKVEERKLRALIKLPEALKDTSGWEVVVTHQAETADIRARHEHAQAGRVVARMPIEVVEAIKSEE